MKYPFYINRQQAYYILTYFNANIKFEETSPNEFVVRLDEDELDKLIDNIEETIYLMAEDLKEKKCDVENDSYMIFLENFHSKLIEIRSTPF